MKFDNSLGCLIILSLGACMEGSTKTTTKPKSLAQKAETLGVETAPTPDHYQIPSEICLADPAAKFSGKVAVGNCFPSEGSCPKGFILGPNDNLISNPKGCTLGAEVEAVMRCAPDPELKNTPGGPFGLCQPYPDGSCPSEFVKIKSVDAIPDSGCSYMRDTTL